MVSHSRKLLLTGLAASTLVMLAVAVWLYTAHAQRSINTDLFGLAIKGYDPVAYFTLNRAVPGDSRYEIVWQDARWRFAKAEHRTLFQGNPGRYMPRYGGFCASALARGKILGADPEAWAIVDGKLFLNWDQAVHDEWLQDSGRQIKRADHEWAALSQRS